MATRPPSPPAALQHLVEAAVGQAGVPLVLRPHVRGREAVAFPVHVLPKAQRRHLRAGEHLSTGTGQEAGAQLELGAQHLMASGVGGHPVR